MQSVDVITFETLSINITVSTSKVISRSMKLKVFVSLVVLQGLLVAIAHGQLIEIEDGSIIGREMATRSGVPFNAFLGIPFAKPPVGELRFRPPERNDPWDGILNGTVYGPMCMQASANGGGASASEDCLQLNVFTKNLPTNDNNTELIPVIVYIHGGGFEAGTASDHGPEYLMDRNIVLVTIQYRLGVFGFIAVGRPDVTGNQGLKDQTLALRWVRDNIHHFGGDRDRVTISGLSAGSFSVTAHMISPMSRGLFHNVIGLSGSVASQIKPETTNTGIVMEVASRVNCTIETVDGMIDCLRNVRRHCVFMSV